jgi:hypothetical protein
MQPTTTKAPKFTPEEDLQLVRLKLQRWSYSEMTDLLSKRTPKSLERRYHRLGQNGERDRLTSYLTERGAVIHGRG